MESDELACRVTTCFTYAKRDKYLGNMEHKVMVVVVIDTLKTISTDTGMKFWMD